jgi:hypothetical protein
MKNTNAIHGNRKQPGKPLLSPRKQVYVYHWDRIIGVGVVFLVLGGLAGYGLSLWSDSSPKEEFDMAETLPKAEVAVEDTRPRLEEEPIHREIEEDPRSFTHVEEDRLPPAVAETTDSSFNSQDTQTPLLDEAIIAEDNPAQQFAENKLNSPFQLKELEILEPSVKRFLLAGSVSNREPEGELNEISFTADGSAAVWAYSEVIDKKGSRFKYVWLHGGNQIATVPVNVGGNRWRSYSSKLINQSMSGAWRVELQDGEGRLMASADFFLE